VLAFFKGSCPVCQLTFPYLERMAQGGRARFAGIGQDDLKTTAAFNQRFGVTFPVLLDTKESGYPVSNAYGISHVPTVFLVESAGEISWVMEGFSRTMMLELGERTGVAPFLPGEFVPEWKSG